jgi:3-oxoadipate enol-lactonase
MRTMHIDADGCRLAFSVTGPEAAPPMLLLNALGTTSDLWAAQVEDFSHLFRVVRCDTRGHGDSDAPAGDYTLDRLGHDALAVLDAVGARRAHVCGVSLGGLVALWLARHAPQRIGRVVAANTGARIGTAALWQQRIAAARAQGMAALAEAALQRWFTERFRQADPDTVDRFRAMLAACPATGYTGCCAALRDADLRGDLDRIAAPTLVVAGTRDRATPPSLGNLVRERVAGAHTVTLDAAHLANVEQAQAFNTAVIEFLTHWDSTWTTESGTRRGWRSGGRSSATPTSTGRSRTPTTPPPKSRT